MINYCSCSKKTDGGGSRLHVSAREYYCYIMQIRNGVFNIFFHGGRLFQQWIVDMYVKIESMRLDWYSNPEHQKIIRADLYQVHLNILASLNMFFCLCAAGFKWGLFSLTGYNGHPCCR